jgi:proteasome regulatory subunit
MQLLAEMDGFNPIGDIKIIAATNRVDILDEALLRPGRFDRIIEIGVPTFEARVCIFKIHTKRMNIAEGINFEALAQKCEGATGADIKAICTEAGMFAIRDNRDTVTLADFEKAIEKMLSEEQSKGMEAGVMFV